MARYGKTNDRIIDDSAEKVRFTQAKIDEIDRARSALLDPRKEVSEIRTAYEHIDQITVRCDCGYEGEEGDMVRFWMH